MGEMIDAIAHQWKNPLVVITGYAELISMDTDSDRITSYNVCYTKLLRKAQKIHRQHHARTRNDAKQTAVEIGMTLFCLQKGAHPETQNRKMKCRNQDVLIVREPEVIGPEVLESVAIELRAHQNKPQCGEQVSYNFV